MKRCMMCGGEGHKLGAMGSLMWYRCRNCGMQFYSERKPNKSHDKAHTGAPGRARTPKG